MTLTLKTPLSLHRSLIQKTPSRKVCTSGENFTLWQTDAKNILKDLLCMPDEDEMPKLTLEYEKPCVLGAIACTERRFYVETEKGYLVPCHLFFPRVADKAMPLMICLQGHSTGMHISFARPKYNGDSETISGGDRDFAVSAVQNGYAALAVEQRCFGECGGTPDGPDCYEAAMAALLIGRTVLGERCFDISRVITAMQANGVFGCIDFGNIYCMGNSGGGTTTYYLACLDSRIKGCIVSCALCTFEASIAARFHCACNYVPDIRLSFEMGELGALIAPRKILIVAGKDDVGFPIDGVKKAYAQLSEGFAHAGVPENCRLVVGNEGHRFYANEAWPIFKELTGHPYGES